MKKSLYILLVFLIVNTFLYSQWETTFDEDNKFHFYENKDFNELIKFPKPVSNTISLIDSVIAIREDSSRKKYSYTHNSSGKLTSFTFEMWEENEFINYGRDIHLRFL